MAAGLPPDAPIVADVPQVGFEAETGGAVLPVPDNATVAGEFVALLVMVKVPLYACSAVGSKVTVTVAVWLGVKMVPFDTPEALNPVPDADTVEIVTFEFPLFVSVTLSGSVLLTVTLPKSSVVGFAPSK
jgi:hypothetical protein